MIDMLTHDRAVAARRGGGRRDGHRDRRHRAQDGSSARASRRWQTSRRLSGSRGWAPGHGIRRRDQASWSAQMYEIFGRDPRTARRSARLLRVRASRGSRARQRTATRRRVGGGPSSSSTSGSSPATGSQRTLHALGHADPARPGCYLGTVQDVTEQRRAERERIELLRGERARGERQPRQERVPRADEPRAAHAAELDHRLQPAAGARRARAAPERARRLRAEGRPAICSS